MIRKLLATTAIVTVATFGAAQAQDGKAMSSTSMEFMTQQATDAHLATNLLGAEVHNANTQDAETIGEVEDLVLAADGTIESVVVGVGGFLGIGEKSVAIEYGSLQWSKDENGDARLIVNATKEQLESAPEFEYARAEGQTQDQLPDTRSSAADRMESAEPYAGGTAMNTPQSDPTAESNANTEMDTRNETAMNTPQADGMAERTNSDFGAMAPAPMDKVTAEQLEGTAVYGANDNNVGEVSDVVLTQSGEVDAVILDVGGFLGIGEKPVAIGFDALEILGDENGNLVLRTKFTEAELESAPEYVERNYPAERDSMRLSGETAQTR